MDWTGAGGSDFATAANWADITAGVTPAASPPQPGNTMQFLGAGGTITGTGTVGQMLFAGTAPWVLNGATLADTGAFTDSGSVLIQNGATVIDSGPAATIDGAAATLAVSGAGTMLNDGTSGYLYVGQSHSGALSIANGATVLAGYTYLGELAGSSGTLTVSGSGAMLRDADDLYVGTSGTGTLTVANGGSVTAPYLDMGYSGASAIVSVDSTSRIEIGTAGTGVAGALTIDQYNGTYSPSIYGDGTIAANLVNNSYVAVDDIASGNTLQVTGSVTGNGSFYLYGGYTTTSNGTVVAIPGGVLQLDASVGSGQFFYFENGSVPATSPALELLDPAAFDGTLEDFTGIGDTLDLAGDTVIGASISGGGAFYTTLHATLSAGGTLAFNLEDTPAATHLTVSGSDITVTPTPTEAWTGAANTDFANASNWDDVTDNINPAASAPGAGDIAEFLSGGGTVIGTGTAGQLTFGGTSPWFVSNGANLSSTGGLADFRHVDDPGRRDHRRYQQRDDLGHRRVYRQRDGVWRVVTAVRDRRTDGRAMGQCLAARHQRRIDRCRQRAGDGHVRLRRRRVGGRLVAARDRHGRDWRRGCDHRRSLQRHYFPGDLWRRNDRREPGKQRQCLCRRSV